MVTLDYVFDSVDTFVVSLDSDATVSIVDDVLPDVVVPRYVSEGCGFLRPV